MRLSHTLGRTSAAFDDPNLVSAGGLLPVLALAESAGLRQLADEHLSVPTDKGANAGLKVSSLVAGMVAGADSIDDMALLRHGGMGRVFARAYAPSTLGSFLRAFTFGHVRQLDAVASRFLVALAGLTRLLDTSMRKQVTASGQGTGQGTERGYALVDVDDTIIEVHGHAKQGAGFGYSGVRGLNALLATLSTATSAPVIVAQRLRKGSAGSPRGAKRLVGEGALLLDVRTGAEFSSGHLPNALNVPLVVWAAIGRGWGSGAQHSQAIHGMLLGVPVPEAEALPEAEARVAVDAALAQIKIAGIRGKAVTPFLLTAIKDSTEGRSLSANVALIRNNARVGAEIAVALAGMMAAK